MIKLISTDTVKGKHDLDIYNLENKGFSTQEIIITVDYTNGEKEIKGEKIAYGSWHDLEENEVNEYMEFIQENNLSVR